LENRGIGGGQAPARRVERPAAVTDERTAQLERRFLLLQLVAEVAYESGHAGPAPRLPAGVGRTRRPRRLALQHVEPDRRRVVSPRDPRISHVIEMKAIDGVIAR